MPLAQPGLKILALSPHTDDAELGAGATIARLIRDGAAVEAVAFSMGNTNTGASAHEFDCACAALGIEAATVLGFEARRYPEQRQDILQWLWDAYGPSADWKPDVVFCPMDGDVHQDHQVIAEEALRVFKHATVLGYEEPLNAIGSSCICPNWYVRLNETHIENKLTALACYESQAQRPAMSPNTVRATATMRGAQCGADYAEAFQLIRHVE